MKMKTWLKKHLNVIIIVLIVAAALLLSWILGMNGIWLAFPCAELLTLAAAIPFLRREMRG